MDSRHDFGYALGSELVTYVTWLTIFLSSRNITSSRGQFLQWPELNVIDFCWLLTTILYNKMIIKGGLLRPRTYCGASEESFGELFGNVCLVCLRGNLLCLLWLLLALTSDCFMFRADVMKWPNEFQICNPNRRNKNTGEKLGRCHVYENYIYCFW